VNLHGKSYRAVVVHSSSHDKRRQKKLDKAIANSIKLINTELDKLTTLYFCEADAKVAAKQAERLSGKLHTVKASIHTVEVRKRGRPPANGPVPTNTRYSLSWSLAEDSAAVDRERSLAGCFVLLSNVPIKGDKSMDGKKLLQTYKGQYNVESDFSFLKDPLVVNDIFLKTPSRIDALGMILIISLMVWRLMERSMRAYVQNTKTELSGWCKRSTDKPTSFMMATAIVGIMVALIDKQRIFLRKPRPRPIAFLAALGLDSSVFLDIGCKCQVIIPINSTKKG
jgi:transposase